MLEGALNMSFIKLTTAAVSLAMFATTAGAGSLVEPEIMPAVEVVEEEDNGSAGMLLPIAALLLIAAAVGGGSSDGTVPVND